MHCSLLQWINRGLGWCSIIRESCSPQNNWKKWHSKSDAATAVQQNLKWHKTAKFPVLGIPTHMDIVTKTVLDGFDAGPSFFNCSWGPPYIRLATPALPNIAEKAVVRFAVVSSPSASSASTAVPTPDLAPAPSIAPDPNPPPAPLYTLAPAFDPPPTRAPTTALFWNFLLFYYRSQFESAPNCFMIIFYLVHRIIGPTMSKIRSIGWTLFEVLYEIGSK